MIFSSTDCRLVIFDLDGTLIDTIPDIAAAVDRAFVSLGYAPPGEARARNWVGNGSKKLIARALASELGCQEADLDGKLLARVQAVFFDCYETGCQQYSRLYTGVLPFLQYLEARNVALACVTNKPQRFTPQVLAGVGIERFFSMVLSGDSLPECKPHPAPLLAVATEMAVAPTEALMVGDSRNDVEAARAAGMPVVCVNYGYNYGESVEQLGADRVVGSLMELLATA